MPASPTAIAILNFGRLLHEEERRHHTDRDSAKLRQTEEQLIERMQHDRSPSLRQILNFNVDRPIEPLVLRVLAYTSYINLCTTRLGIGVGEIVNAVAGEEPAAALETRQVVSRLLIARQLTLKSGGTVELGQPLLTFLAGGKDSPPLVLTEWTLHAALRNARVQAERKKARDPVAITALPTAKQLATRIAADVIGLHGQIRTISCRIALHMRRAALLRCRKDPKSPNESILCIGRSGVGKTWLLECAGRSCGLPFAVTDSNDLTAEGYIGLSVDDPIKGLITAANNDIETARYGVCMYDEWDKRRVSGWEFGERDVGGASVQQAVLRLIEGTVIQVGGRRGAYDCAPVMFDSHGTFFAFAGAFTGLDTLLQKRVGGGIGFSGGTGQAKQARFLYDALQDFGLIAEFCNRLTAVLIFPSPTIQQLTEIANKSVIPSYNRLLSACEAKIEINDDGVRLLAEYALESETFARGLKSVISALIEDLVFEGRQGSVKFGIAEVRRALDGLCVEN